MSEEKPRTHRDSTHKSPHTHLLPYHPTSHTFPSPSLPLPTAAGAPIPDLLKKLERQLGLPHPPDVPDPPLHEALRAVGAEEQ